MNRLEAQRVREGKCIRKSCGLPLATSTMCRAHADKQNANYARHKDRLLAAGVCSNCWRRPIGVGLKRFCVVCSDSMNARNNGHGLDHNGYASMLAAQQGKCALCGSAEAGGKGKQRNRFHVDHDHATMKIRGLLCSRCNKGIGLFGDSAVLLEKAAAYVRGPVVCSSNPIYEEP